MADKKEEIKTAVETAETVAKEAVAKTADKGKKAAAKAKTATKKAAAKTRAVAADTAAKAKKAAAAVNDSVFVEFGDKQIDVAAVIEAVRADYKSKGKRAPKSVAVYIKPEEGVAYYTVNGKEPEGEQKVDL